jgi:RNA polymerase sigma factor (sigma-70 family)
LTIEVSKPVGRADRDRANCEERSGGRTRRNQLPEAVVADLVASAAAGNEGSWGELFAEYSGLVWAVARAHRLSHADAADVAQTTWTRLLEHLPRLAEPERVGAWMATVARRESLRVLRLADRQLPYGDDRPDGESHLGVPGEEMLLLERNAALWRACDSLQARDRDLLRLLTADQRPSYEEIAAALEIPIGSIGPTRARALERLRRKLDAHSEIDLLAA